MMTTAMCHVNYVHTVMVIMYMIPIGDIIGLPAGFIHIGNIKSELQAYSTRNYLDNHLIAYIMRLTLMKRPKASKPSRAVDPKAEVLRQQGALHPKPDTVQDEAFRQGEFFDARDLVQVRYEMLRRHQVDGQAVTEVAVAFGVSRQAFYTTETAFEQMGISGLLPRRRGPKRAHKCTDEVLDFVEQWRATSPTEKDVTEAIQRRFGVSLNPRSIERALTRRKKKR
jgi:transposase